MYCRPDAALGLLLLVKRNIAIRPEPGVYAALPSLSKLKADESKNTSDGYNKESEDTRDR